MGKQVKFRVDVSGNTAICIPKAIQETGDENIYWGVSKSGTSIILESGCAPSFTYYDLFPENE